MAREFKMRYTSIILLCYQSLDLIGPSQHCECQAVLMARSFDAHYHMGPCHHYAFYSLNNILLQLTLSNLICFSTIYYIRKFMVFYYFTLNPFFFICMMPHLYKHLSDQQPQLANFELLTYLASFFSQNKRLIQTEY